MTSTDRARQALLLELGCCGHALSHVVLGGSCETCERLVLRVAREIDQAVARERGEILGIFEGTERRAAVRLVRARGERS